MEHSCLLSHLRLAIYHVLLLVTPALFARDDLSISLKTKFSSNGPVSLLCCEGPAPPLNITTQVYNHYLGGINLNPATHADQIIQVHPPSLHHPCSYHVTNTWLLLYYNNSYQVASAPICQSASVPVYIMLLSTCWSCLEQMFGDWYTTYVSDLGAMLHAKNFQHIKKSFSYELQHRGQLSFGDSFVPELSNDCELL